MKYGSKDDVIYEVKDCASDDSSNNSHVDNDW